MIEEANVNEVEVTEETQVQSDVAPPAEQQPEQAPIEQPETPNQDQVNFRQLREQQELERERAIRAEYERDQLMQYIQAQQQQKQQPQQAPNPLGLSDDDYVEGKHLGKVNKSVEELKREVQQWKAHNEEVTAELKLTSEFNDFNNVVTSKNVEKLLKEYPELSSTVRGNDPLYNRGKATYRLIKKFLGDNTKQTIKQSMPQSMPQKQVPRSAATLKGTSSVSNIGLDANGHMTPERRAYLRRQMDDAINNY